mgnify:CR=1 FL=1
MELKELSYLIIIMFTGIIKYISEINKIDNVIIVELNDRYSLGESISINGCCLTISNIYENKYTFILSKETEKICCFKKLCNIEPAVKSSERLGGHIVSGHIDCIGIIKNVTENELEIIFDSKYYHLLRKKGSISVDGISLTIAELNNNYFKVNIIPHTYNNTIIQYYVIADIINLEFDHYIPKWTHEEYMNYSIELSETNKGYTLPNPWVGAVITNTVGEILSTGYHKEFGKEHAEINAIKTLKEQYTENELINLPLILYCTLEPCSHIGKTNSCAKELLNYNFKEIHIGIKDPNPIVSGKGIEILNSKFKVYVGILENKVKESLKEYIYYYTNSIPFITGKIATSLNGTFSQNSERLIVSSEEALIDSHKLRSECSAILIGENTYLMDIPKLNVRYNFKEGQFYRKFVLGDIDSTEFTSIIINDKLEESIIENKWTFKNIISFLEYLYSQKVIHLLIEGGNKTLLYFEDYLNEMITYMNCNYYSGNQFTLNNNYTIIKSECYKNYYKITTESTKLQQLD